MKNVVNALQREIRGEVRFDRASRVLYSTDASLYQIEPLGVVLPRDRQDIVAVHQIAEAFGVPVIPRGGGTGLAGQSVGRAVIMDMSKYMHGILDFDPEQRRVRVQPGVVLDELNAFLKPHGLQFAPDVATSNRANVGGMIGNNSAGARSLIYGKTIDHVESVDVVFADGTEATFAEVEGAGLRQKLASGGFEGDAYREVLRLAERHRDEVERRYPKILRRVGGYNLDAFVGDGPVNMARMVVGSEGTLATVAEAVVELVPLPGAKVLGVIQFHDLLEAMAAVVPILETGPAAVELVDKMILDQTRGSIALSRQRAWVEGDPEAVLAIEYSGDSTEQILPKLDELQSVMEANRFGYAFGRAVSADEQANVWNVRKAGLGLLMGIKGDSKPVAFVEDSAVAPESLADYIEAFDGIVRSHDTSAGYYAHASVGLLHIRPLVNLKTADGVAKMRSIAEQVRDLVLKHGGAMSGEHGDGLVRSCWNEQMFGTRLYNAFREIKRCFDPKGLMNPGKIVDAQMMTENLRFGAAYQAQDLKTHFDFSADGGFHRAVEMCNGVGACRKKLEGTMCPTYVATMEEEHSTRGRANALRAAISGQWEGGLGDQRLFDVLDLCLECKACKSECPSNVDLAKLKYEFLSHYYRINGRPLRAWFFGNIEAVNRLGCALAPLSNWIAGLGLSRRVMGLMGIASQRHLPPFARPTFTEWFGARKGLKSHRKVVLFHDTYLTYNYPSIGIAATEFLEAAGIEVVLPDKRCCGRPLLSSGMIEDAKANARHNVATLYPLVEQGCDIIGFEPSCVSMLTDDYLDLVPGPRTQAVADHVYTFEGYVDMLHARGDLGVSFQDLGKKILFHGHCHQKALWGVDASVRVLGLPRGFQVSEIDSGCCGMAGSFGYEAEHYEMSLKVGDDRLLRIVNDAPAEAEIAVAGVSCRQQIAHATGRAARHPAEILRDAVAPGGPDDG